MRKTANTFGDPHLKTFDNLRYDFQAVGEFFASLDPGDPAFSVQIRLVPAWGPYASRVGAFAAMVAGDRVTAELDIFAPVRPPKVNGVESPLADGQARWMTGGGLLVGLPGGHFKITWPTGEVLRTRAGGFELSINPARPRALVGLLGSPDNDPSNDLTMRSGEVVGPRSFADFYATYGNTWRITDAESLFDYEPGTNTTFFTDLSRPLALPQPAPSARATATSACRSAGAMDDVTFEACVVDVATSGLSDLATAAKENVPPLAAGLVDISVSPTVTYRVEQGSPGAPGTIGCADGQREGLLDLVRFPHVAACLGTWPDAKSLRASPTGTACGDDLGPCTVPADICAPGWHVCGATGDPAELHRLTASECEHAGGGSYVTAMSYCSSKTASCSYSTSPGEAYGCADGGTCSEPVCCGGACGGFGGCVDGVFTGKTHIIPDGNACGAAYARLAGGVLCCDSGASSTTCNGVVLDDGNPCTRDSCDPVAGVLHLPIPGLSCSDGNACNGLEVCDATGTCKAGVAVVVDDGNACTTDVCDPVAGVSHTPTPGASCSDANVCNGQETCSAAGICRPGTPPTVDDGDACTTDTCDPVTGVHHVAIALDDGNPCTVDACDKIAGVSHTAKAAGADCSDGNACNGAETCDSSGICRPGTTINVDDGNACTADACDPSTGAVSHANVPSGTTCPNANPCDGIEVCDGAGHCGAGAPANVDDGNPCTADSCDPVAGFRHVGFGGCAGDSAGLVAGANHTCELRPDGTVSCWGDNSVGQASPPAGETFVQISAGQDHTCGLRSNGTVRCWGSNTFGQLNVSSTEVYKYVSAGDRTTCAVRLDGTVRCNGNWTTTAPPSTEVVSSVAGGFNASCALEAGGVVKCWGLTGAPTTGKYGQIALSYGTACALRVDGVPACWGTNNFGQASPTLGYAYTQLSVGTTASCGITDLGEIRCWGSNANGQLAVPAGTFRRVAVGNAHACAVRLDGSIVCWGNNANGQAPAVITPTTLPVATVGTAYAYAVTFGPPYSSTTAAYTVASGTFPPGLSLSSTGALSGTPTAASTYSFTLAYTDGSGFSVSQAYELVVDDPRLDGAFCTNDTQCASGRCRGEQCCSGGADCAVVRAGANHTCELRPDGTPLCWGDNASGQASPPTGERFVSLSTGTDHTCGLRANGTVRCWGGNGAGQLNVPASEVYAQINAGWFTTCGVRADGSVKCYGNRAAAVPPTGQVYVAAYAGNDFNCALRPNGSLWCSSSDVLPTGSFSRLSVASAACAVRRDGSPACWGWNVFGQATPPTGSTFGQVSAGYSGQAASCGLTAAGAIQCWGNNANGQLAAPSGSFTRVTVGAQHACALRADGAVVCWGSNAKGQAPALINPVTLGAGTLGVAYAYTMSFGPPYSSSSAAYSVSAGTLPPGLTLGSGGLLSGVPTALGSYAFTITYADGAGFTSTQSYGIVIRDKRAEGERCTSPSECTSGTCMSETCCSGANCSAVVAGARHTCLLRSDGTPVCWGDNAYGQASPPAGEIFVELAAGATHTCGLRASGTVRCWGNASSASPPGTETYRQISAGEGTTCGVRTDGTVRCYGAAATTAPAANEVFATSAVGSGATCELRPDGTVGCQGNESYGLPKAPAGSFTQISLSSATACAVRSDSTLLCWGYDFFGQAAAPTGVGFRQVSAGGQGTNASCGVTTEGTVRCWGGNLYGMLSTPTGTFRQVATGATHACAIGTDGVVVCWGNNANGQAPATFAPLNLDNATVGVAYSRTLTFGPPYSSTTPAYSVTSGSLPPGLSLGSATGVVSGSPTTAGSFGFTVTYADGSGFVATQVYTIVVSEPLADGEACTGAGQCASGKCRSEMCCGTTVDCTTITAGGTHSCELKPDGTAYCWGNNVDGQSTVPAGETFVEISAGQNHTCGLRPAGTVRCWGSNGQGQLNVPLTETYRQIFAGDAITCGVRTDGTVKCYGKSATNVPPTTQLFTSFTAGSSANCGLKPDASLACYGTISGTPAGTFKQASMSWQTACAVRSDGSGVCWGSNGSGQATAPSGVSFVQMSSSQTVSCGVTTAGAIRCWGSNTNGQLTVPTGTFTRVSVGNTHVCAIRTDGVPVCWGNNSNGQTTVPG